VLARLRRWFRSWFQHQGSGRRHLARRLELQILEDRLVPAPVVVTSVADAGPGTLRQAVADANTGDTITFDVGVNRSITLNGEILINNKSLIIDGANNNITLDGGGASRIFDLTYDQGQPVPTVELDNLTFTNCFAPGLAEPAPVLAERSCRPPT
jgi:hypothetical protein